MTVETETILIKLLEELKAEFKELKTDVKETNKRLNSIEVNQARLEGKIDTLQVEQKNLTSGQDAINVKLNNQKAWLLTVLTGLMLGILGLIAAVGKVVFFPST